jgi:hypothetical protein
MGVSTVETNRDQDRDRDCPLCRDQFLKPVEIFSTVKIDFYFISVEIFKIETFQSRLCRVEIFVEIVEICRDCRDLSRRSQDAVEMQSRFVEKSRRENTKSMHFSIEIETNCRESPKFSDLDEFLDLDRDFLVWTLMSRLNREISISTEISRSSRLTFENRRDYPSRRD